MIEHTKQKTRCSDTCTYPLIVGLGCCSLSGTDAFRVVDAQFYIGVDMTGGPVSLLKQINSAFNDQ